MIENAHVHKYTHTHQMTCVYVHARTRPRISYEIYILYTIPILIHLDKI